MTFKRKTGRTSDFLATAAELPDDMRRGIPVQNLLGANGVVLRRRADTLCHEEQTKLYDRSTEVPYLDCTPQPAQTTLTRDTTHIVAAFLYIDETLGATCACGTRQTS